MQKSIMLILVFACGPAEASEWALVAKYADGSSALVDVSNIRIAGIDRSAWFKYLHKPHTLKGLGENSGKWVSYDLSREVYDCTKGNRQTEALFVYYDDGTNSGAIAMDNKWRPVPPDSLAEDQMKFLCAWKPK